MKHHPFLTASTAILLGLHVPADAAVVAPAEGDATPQSEAVPVSPGRELLRVTNDMWFLLAGVADLKSADAAAPRFSALVSEASKIGDDLLGEDGQGQDLEALEMLHYHIAEALEALNDEFRSLCRARCYGSANLIQAFHKSVDAGMFDGDLVAELELPKPPMTESEARREIVRLKRLVEPDRALLELLQSVQDAKSADSVVKRLQTLSTNLQKLLPEEAVANRDFSASSAGRAREAYEPVATLLWGIRSEIVRIAGLPGYDGASYDRFSDALDSVYEGLGDTHTAWFDDVFDASFRSDLDEALHENATTSN